MCGRFAFQVTGEILASYFELDEIPQLDARYNVAPTQPAPVVRLDRAGRPKLKEIRWGLIPFWAKSESLGARMINARAETVAEKPAYRTPFRRRRCLLAASGFYEWQSTPDGKQPVYFTDPSGVPFAFAGLWDRWKTADGNVVDSCAIVTVPAVGVVVPIHDRMPLILDKAHHRTWLDPASPIEKVKPILEAPSRALACWPVSKRVNDPRNEGMELIEAVD